MTKAPNGSAPEGDVDIDIGTPVTTIIRQQPRPDAVNRYEAWLREVIPVAQGFTGHRGVNVIRPHGVAEPYTIVLHFDSVPNLRGWLDSDTRLKLVEKIRPYLADSEAVDIKTGLEFWFTPTGGKVAKPYKQFLLTLSAIFPLTLVVPFVLQPVLRPLAQLPIPLLGSLLVTACIVGLMVYVVMPHYTRLVRRWLFK
jgi:antibiotic biosynthesis monooxygenase (ABM) superfamily enzyme